MRDFGEIQSIGAVLIDKEVYLNTNMKCAVAIVLALIGMSLAHPAPSGLSGLVSPLLLPAVEARSSIVNHGYTIPRIPIVPIIKQIPIIKPLIVEPIIKVPIIKSIYGGYGDLGGYGLH